MGRYTPGPTPAPAASAEQLRQWLDGELHAVGAEMRDGAELVTHYNIQGTAPPRPRLGDVGMFAAGAVGTLPGLYLYGVGAEWERIDTRFGLAERWTGAGTDPMPAAPATVAPLTFDPVLPGEGAQLFSEAGGVLTALRSFIASLQMVAQIEVRITANNGELGWFIDSEQTPGPDRVLPLTDFRTSSRSVTFTALQTVSGHVVMSPGETLAVRESLTTATSANCWLEALRLDFGQVVLIG